MIIEVTPFVLDCSEKEQACKVLEEAAEVFGAWQEIDACCGPRQCEQCEIINVCAMPVEFADEIADVIQAACNLAERYGIDVEKAMRRCTERQHERGRI